MREWTGVFLLVFCLPSLGAPPGPSTAEALRLLRFQTVEGDTPFADAEVTCILQDGTGFVWFGTYTHGLFRFDGHELRHFASDPDDPTTLGGNSVWTMCEDREGSLWVGTWGAGLSRFDPRLQRFERFRHSKEDPSSLSDDTISALLVDSSGTLWIGTFRGGLNARERKAGGSYRFRRLQHDPTDPSSLGSDQIWSLVESSGSLWIGHRYAGLDSLALPADPGRKPRFDHFRARSDDRGSISSDRIWAMARSSDGSLWIGTDGAGLDRFDPRAGRARRLREARGEVLSDAIRFVFEDRSGAVWIGSPHLGLERFDPGTGSRVPYRHREGDATSIASDHVVSCLEDADGLLWFGTWGSGASRLDPRTARFGLQTHRADDPAGLGPGTVNAILEDASGTLWVGTERGLNRRTSAAGAAPIYVRQPGPLGKVYVSALFEDRDGTLWIGTDEGLYSLPDRTGHPIGPKERVTVIRQAPDGVLWFGSWKSGLCRWDGAKLTIHSINVFLSPAGDNAQIRALCVDAAGRFWIGTLSDGLFLFDPSRGSCEPYPYPAGEDRIPGSKRVLDILASPGGDLWLATHGAGLLRFRPDSGRLQRYGEKEGLSSSFVVRILPDDRGRLWLATARGIDRFDPRDSSVAHYDIADGLQASSFSTFDAASHRARGGRLYFGGLKGFNAFHPDELDRDVEGPPRPPVVTQFLLRNRPVPVSAQGVLSLDTPFVESLTLSHTDYLMGFEFSALAFRHPGRVRYAYKLDGFDDHWIETGPRDRKAVYTSLPPREYTFRVRASSRPGRWVETPSGIRIRVRPPWWRTWWAYALYVAGAVGLVASGVRYRVYQLKRKSAELSALVVERTKELAESERRALEARREALEASRAKSVFLANMSHELRTPLNAILGFAQLMDRSRELDAENRRSVRTILRSGDHLLGLINDVLSLSKIEAGRVALADAPFDLLSLLETVRTMIDVRVERKEVALVFDLDPSLPRFVRGDGQKLRQVVLNLLSNAVNYTERGSIRLSARWERGRAHVEVADTGVGIPENEIGRLFEEFVQTSSGQRAYESTGLGLAISRRIVRLMGGDLGVRSRVGLGTTFTFEVDLPEAPPTVEELAARRVVALEGWPHARAPRILVVDDGPDNRTLLVKLLESTGFQAREAADGEQAIAVWREWSPDLVFMDIRMPVMDGREAIRRIREVEAGDAARARTPIVALTASVLEHERGEILAGGADDFLAKPFRESALFAKLGERLGCRYTYEESAEGSAVTGPEGDDVLTSERLATIPSDLSRELYATLTTGDVEKAGRVVGRIEVGDAPLGRALTSAIRDYRLDELLELLERSGVSRPTDRT